MTHIGKVHLARLAARLLQLRAELDHFRSVSTFLAQKGPQEIISRLATATAKNGVTLRADAESPALHSYLLRVWEQVVDNHEEPLSALESTAFGQALKSYITDNPCARCKSPPYCTLEDTPEALAADDQMLVEHGFCISPLKELFEAANALARHHYGPVVGTASPPVVEFQTGHTDRVDPLLAVALSAETRPAPPNSMAQRVVHLSINIDNFCAESYFGALYILVHECIAHAWCGLELGTAESSDSYAFHDGWMDHIARDLLVAGLHSSGPRALEPFRRYARKIKGKTDSLGQQRRARVPDPRPDDPRPVADAGVDAAEKLYDALNGLLGDGKGAALFQRFSLALNASTYPDENRGTLVVAVNYLFAGNDPSEVVIEASLALESLIAGGDAETFATAIENIYLRQSSSAKPALPGVS